MTLTSTPTYADDWQNYNGTLGDILGDEADRLQRQAEGTRKAITRWLPQDMPSETATRYIKKLNQTLRAQAWNRDMSLLADSTSRGQIAGQPQLEASLRDNAVSWLRAHDAAVRQGLEAEAQLARRVLVRIVTRDFTTIDEELAG